MAQIESAVEKIDSTRAPQRHTFNVFDFEITPRMELTYISMMNTQRISFSVSLRKTTNCAS